MKDQLGHLVLSASSIKGTTVKNAVDEKIGSIEDIMMDCATGEAAYVVLSVDSGFLNLGSKYFAVPWQAFAFDTAQEDVFILNVDKEKLKNSPGFDKDNWPTGPQLEFITEIRDYYGYKRPWETDPGYTGLDSDETLRGRYEERRDPGEKESDFLG
ncbi:PRC-barrel domain-containing protein [Negadavirga shengliensis]|uniref:PRC-barrel domain-containing protein n=1 Tax=Negadavirga shengliensis TaxID=1389218 RepID=A0ABV9SZS8_9BACT